MSDQIAVALIAALGTIVAAILPRYVPQLERKLGTGSGDYAIRVATGAVLIVPSTLTAVALSLWLNPPLPVGTIVPWHPVVQGGADAESRRASLRDVPLGWEVCDGLNGTPDLDGRVLYGVHTQGRAGQIVAQGNEANPPRRATQTTPIEENSPRLLWTVANAGPISDEEMWLKRAESASQSAAMSAARATSAANEAKRMAELAAATFDPKPSGYTVVFLKRTD